MVVNENLSNLITLSDLLNILFLNTHSLVETLNQLVEVKIFLFLDEINDGCLVVRDLTVGCCDLRLY